MPHERKRGMWASARSSTAPEPPESSGFPVADNSHPVPLSNANRRNAHRKGPWPRAGTEHPPASDRLPDSATTWFPQVAKRRTSRACHLVIAAQALKDSVDRQRFAESQAAALSSIELEQSGM